MRFLPPALVLAVAVLAPSPARAIHLGVDVGGGAWLLEAPLVDVHFRLDQELFDWLRIGVRPGVGVNFASPDARFTVPLAGSVKLKFLVFFLEIFAGILWIPSHANPIRTNLGGGLGLRLWKLELGIELAYLQPSISVGGRIGFTFYGPDKKEEKPEEAR
jgi:hypothetical protein